MYKNIPQTHTIESERLHLSIPVENDIPYVYEALHSDGFMDGMTSEPPSREILQNSLANMHDNWLEGKSYAFSAYFKDL